MATIVSPRPSSPAGTPRIKSPSIADTPTSSTRGSLDLSSASTPRPPQRRNRAALRDYYNLKKPQAETLSRTASIASVASDSTLASIEPTGTTSTVTAQLDKQDFDENEYISRLLSTSSLREILKVEATLVSEIRNLDGERKALVYDNYSKLIKAVGTIGEMQKGMHGEQGGLKEIDGLEKKMDELRTSVVELASERGGDDGSSRHKRLQRKTQEEKRAIVSRVVNAPRNLQKLIDSGKTDEAVKEWDVVLSYLGKWKDVKGVSEIRQKCEQIMAKDESDVASDG